MEARDFELAELPKQFEQLAHARVHAGRGGTFALRRRSGGKYADARKRRTQCHRARELVLLEPVVREHQQVVLARDPVEALVEIPARDFQPPEPGRPDAREFAAHHGQDQCAEQAIGGGGPGQHPELACTKPEPNQDRAGQQPRHHAVTQRKQRGRKRKPWEIGADEEGVGRVGPVGQCGRQQGQRNRLEPDPCRAPRGRQQAFEIHATALTCLPGSRKAAPGQASAPLRRALPGSSPTCRPTRSRRRPPYRGRRP